MSHPEGTGSDEMDPPGGAVVVTERTDDAVVLPTRNEDDYKPPARKLLGGQYDLEAGKVNCQCLRRKWKFCHLIKELADGKVTPRLLQAKEGPPSRWEGWTGKPGIMMMQHHHQNDDDDGDAEEEQEEQQENGNGGESEWGQALRLLMLTNNSTPPKEDDGDHVEGNININDDDDQEDDYRLSKVNSTLENSTPEGKQNTLLDYGFKQNYDTNRKALKQNQHQIVSRGRKRARKKDATPMKQLTLDLVLGLSDDKTKVRKVTRARRLIPR